jgi:hypothetical protein
MVTFAGSIFERFRMRWLVLRDDGRGVLSDMNLSISNTYCYFRGRVTPDERDAPQPLLPKQIKIVPLPFIGRSFNLRGLTLNGSDVRGSRYVTGVR